MRVLVSQLSNVGRDVRATSMQWAYEGKKLDSAVKHMSWVPPWVEGGGAVAEPVGRRFMGPDSVTVQDEVGLGRHPPLWWTMNCHYNAAYDVQRMNVGSTNVAAQRSPSRSTATAAHHAAPPFCRRTQEATPGFPRS